MLLEAGLSGRQKPIGDCEEPRLPVAMPAPIDGGGFEAKMNGGEMSAWRDPRLAQDRRREQAASRRRRR
ncbi:hypothetical protein RGCCGE502_17600 [Rhizobium grahamii CCGE 502]|uniref:Uncharacterized protein n=1 Tax=Rhizobium grahamii CCGE 502 TaxID=990285 RepID=S3ICM2_9HYPH|nr:hypothetical protein RGCCGE502_17600 [Rhizobium grahamii CCGE 502]